MSKKKLAAKQQRFIDEFIVDSNAAQAAIRAGYSKKTAGKIGYQLLENTRIAEEIAKKQKKLADKLEITAEKILKEYAKIAFSNMQDFVDWADGAISIKPSSELTKEQTACVSEISESVTQAGTNIKIKLHDKKGALDSLARHLGMFTDKVELSGKDGQPIQTVNVTMTEAEAAQTYLDNLKK